MPPRKRAETAASSGTAVTKSAARSVAKSAAAPRKRSAGTTKGTASKRTASKGTASKGTASKGTASKGTASKGTASKGTASNGTASKGTAARKQTSRSTAPGTTRPVAAKAGTKDALAAGAARASGERARRRGTPLIAVPDLDRATSRSTGAVATATERPAAAGRQAVAGRPAATKHRPRPVPKAATPAPKVLAREGGRRRAESRPLRPVPDLPDAPALAEEVDAPRAGAATTRTVVPGLEDLVQAGVAALRAVVVASGVAPEDVEAQVARTLAFLRRRLTGEFEVDEFGFDEDFTVNAYLPLLRPLYKSWFRVDVRGIENIPAEGGGLVVANHSGTLAFDSLMTQVAVYDETPTHRHLRMLGADYVFQTPVVSQMARKSGSTLAANVDAERLLGQGELVGVWPEGFKGIGKPFSERYKLQRFGRGGFVASAIRAGVPIVPCSIVGAEEIYPLLGNMKTLARLIGAPYAPITPTWPWLGPLGLIPLPSKWLIEFGAPVHTADLGPGAAEDPMLIFDLTDRTRETIQQTLYSLLMQRRSVFF